MRRHKCSQQKDKTTASYWACRLPYYAKQLGLSDGETFTGKEYIMLVSEYWDNDRRAVIRKEKEGFEVDLFKNNYKETRKVHNHSESYAEDVAENFMSKGYLT